MAALGALGDPTRRAIFELLVVRPRAVGELANELPVSRPAVSQHLKVLKEVGLVTDHAQGTRRLYRVERRGIAALREYLDRLWDDALLAFAVEVERGADTADKKADKRQGASHDRTQGDRDATQPHVRAAQDGTNQRRPTG
jgi:DNA-binding transcriptional ArsR family regulator